MSTTPITREQRQNQDVPCGFLWFKKTKFPKKWKKRFVVLDLNNFELQIFSNDQVRNQTLLFIFHSSSKEFTPKKIIDLKELSTSQGVTFEQKDKKKFVFKLWRVKSKKKKKTHRNSIVSVSMKKYKFATDSMEDRDLWVSRITTAMNKYQVCSQE